MLAYVNRICTGDFERNQIEWGMDNALAAVLGSIAYELTQLSMGKRY